MANLANADILELSVSERIQLVEDIWDSIAEVPNSIQLSDQQKDELDQRLDSYHKNPSQGSPWSVVRKKLMENSCR
ncbi:MAG: addiction module protein [Deltaproteobacteria bacterium]|jgi:putative addiction module component (TIGR02574 family)|nr:addiction module protein [Deltaproteobacteria bacterium]